MQDLTINQAIDLAVAKMRPIRRAVMQRRLKNADYRKSVADELTLKLWDDAECCALVPAFNAAKASDAFGAATTFAIDPGNLDKFLEIIMKWLPQILEMILKFLPLFIGLLLACLIAAPANAQNYPAVGGASGLGSSGSKVASLGSSGTKAAGLASSGSHASYGSSGSAARKFRPLRSILERAPVRVAVGTTVNLAANTANVVRDSVSNAYQVALASATQRAAMRRKGHLMSVEAGHTVGVGWSSFDSQPNTCFGRGGDGYAVVRGADGWYSTKVVR